MCLFVYFSLFLSVKDFLWSQTQTINNQVILLAWLIKKWHYFSVTKETVHRTGRWDTFSTLSLRQLQSPKWAKATAIYEGAILNNKKNELSD